MESTQSLNLSELKTWCQEFIPLLEPKTLVFLNGPLGVGKTQWVKTVLSFMGIPDASSPTFSLINNYEDKVKKLKIYHVDLYRIESETDLESIGFWDLLENENGLIFVEWSQKVSPHLWPRDWIQYSLDLEFSKNEDSRLYNFKRIHP